MKNLKGISAVILVLLGLFACEKDENKPDEGGTVTLETVSGKWVVEGAGEYQSFEFNESGNYIIVRNTPGSSLYQNPVAKTDEQIVFFGSFTIANNRILNLSDFGTIKDISIDGDIITFTLLVNGNPNKELRIHAVKQDEMPQSTRTELLCRTWELVTLDGENVVGTHYELTVVFSAAGTYFVSFVNPADEDSGGLAQWKWKDEDEVTFCYSWEGAPECDGYNSVEILELSATRLKMAEGETIYELKPLAATPSAARKTISVPVGVKMESGLFKK